MARDLKPGKDLDSFGNSMMNKISRESRDRLMRLASKRRRQRARRRIREDQDDRG